MVKAISSQRHIDPLAAISTINAMVIIILTHPPNSICGWLDSFVIPNTSGIKSPLKLKRKH